MEIRKTGDMQIFQFPCLKDNYGYLIHDDASGATACIDTPETGPILAALEETGWQLTHILNTHHHFDHAGNNEPIKAKTGCIVVGPGHDADRIPALDVGVREGDQVEVGELTAEVLETPGHTSGHIVYWFSQEAVAFVGDTLFALGCGRVFEGTPAQMWSSLQKVAALPDETSVYCAHEYTQSNARFAITVDPGNADLMARAREIDELRDQGLPTVPSQLGEEKATNPFLRPWSETLKAGLGMEGADDVDVWAETRRRKDHF